MEQFALDFEAHDEEEDGHEAVVDDLVEVEVERDERAVELERGIPEVEVVGFPGGVGPDEGGDGGEEEGDAAEGFGADEFLHRADEALGHEDAARVERAAEGATGWGGHWPSITGRREQGTGNRERGTVAHCVR